jgi:streptogramin lyase
MKKIKSLLWLFILGIITSLQAQTNYSYTNFTTAQGLPINNIKTVAVDQSGNIWFGSTAGLTRYNGFTMTTFTTAQGLIHNTVNDLYIAPNGDILVATDNGLSRYNGTTFTNSLSGTIIRCVYAEPNGNIWIGTAGGGVRRYTTAWATWTTTNGIPHNFVNTITKDQNGNIWIGTSEGVGKFNGTTWTSYTSINGSNTDADQVISSTCDADGVMWFGSKPSLGIGGGVTRFNGTAWTYYNITDGLAGRQVEDMISDSENRKWIATFNNGASLLTDPAFPQVNFTTLSNAGGLISNQVQGVAIDQDGHIWFATQNGVSKLTPVKFNSIQKIDAKCNTNFQGSVIVNAGGLSTLFYSIDGGTTFQTSGTFNNLAPGTYEVIISDGIYSSTTPDVTIEVIDPVSPGLQSTFSVCSGDSVQIIVPNQGSNYQWTPPAHLSSDTVFNPMVSPPSSQYYYLSMLDANGCPVLDTTYVQVAESSPMTLQVNGNIFTCTGNFVSYVWTYYDDVIPGAFTNIYAATQPGIYGVYATNSNNCTTYSGMIHYNNTGFEEYDQPLSMNIYQSESSIIFTITGKLSSDKLIMYDITGKIVSEIMLNKTSENTYSAQYFPVETPAGVYFVRIDGTSLSGKFSFFK